MQFVDFFAGIGGIRSKEFVVHHINGDSIKVMFGVMLKLLMWHVISVKD